MGLGHIHSYILLHILDGDYEDDGQETILVYSEFLFWKRVGLAYELDDQGSIPDRGISLLTDASRQALGPIQPHMLRYRAFFRKYKLCTICPPRRIPDLSDVLVLQAASTRFNVARASPLAGMRV